RGGGRGFGGARREGGRNFSGERREGGRGDGRRFCGGRREGRAPRRDDFPRRRCFGGGGVSSLHSRLFYTSDAAHHSPCGGLRG
ncbi:hypothetical protein CWM42_25740, partial [Escherichia coli]|uniref:hypothetical protein n=1 Tax=Escherichia coli TaxID=562 RepID=UPI000CA7ECF1